MHHIEALGENCECYECDPVNFHLATFAIEDRDPIYMHHIEALGENCECYECMHSEYLGENCECYECDPVNFERHFEKWISINAKNIKPAVRTKDETL